MPLFGMSTPDEAQQQINQEPQDQGGLFQQTQDPGLTAASQPSAQQPAAQAAPQANSLFGGTGENGSFQGAVPIDMEESKRRRAILNQMAQRDEIPPIPKVMDAILSGQVNVEAVKDRYKEFKAKNPSFVGDKSEGINKPSDLKALSETSSGLPPATQNGFVASLQDAFKVPDYIAKKVASGLTFGAYSPDQEAPDPITAVSGTIGMVAGMVLSGMAGGAAVKAIPGIGGAISGLEASAEVTPGLFGKLAKKAGAVALESAPLGAAVGTVTSLSHGNDLSDALKDGVIDGALWAATGAALTPLAEGAGRLFAKTKINRAAAVSGMAEAAGAGTAEAIAQSLSLPGENSNTLLSRLESTPVEQRTEQESRVLDSLNKIKSSQAFTGPGMATEIAKNPEITSMEHQQNLKNVSDQVFKEGPLSYLYENDQAIKSMVDSGNYADALSSVDGVFSKVIKQYPALGEYISAPFVNDAASVNKVVAQRFANNAAKLGFADPNLPTLITNYMTEQTPASEAALKNAVPAKQGRIFGKGFFEEGGVADIRLGSRDVDRLVTEQLKSITETVANRGIVKLGDIRTISDPEAILKAAVTLNKDLQNTVVGAAKEGFGKFSEYFQHMPPELQDAFSDQVRVRASMKEMGPAIARKGALRTQLDDLMNQLKSTSNPEEVESIKKQIAGIKDDITTTTKSITTMSKNYNQAQSSIASLTTEQQTQLNSLADQIFIPTKTQMGTKSTQDYLSRFGSKENPYYIDKNSKLADYLSAIAVSGKEYDLKPLKGIFGGPFAINIESPIRQIQRQLGPGNPLSDGLLIEIKDRQAAAALKTEEQLNSVSQFKIDPDSKEDFILQRIGEGKMLPSDPDFLALKPERQQAILEAVPQVKKILQESFDAHNKIAVDNNLPAVSFRENYMGPHIQDHDASFGEVVKGFLNGEKDIPLPYEGTTPLNIQLLTKQSDPTKSFFSYELRRTGDSSDHGAMYGLQKYLGSMNRRISTMDLIRQTDVARSFAPKGFATVLDQIKDQILLGVPHQLDKELGQAPIMKRGIAFTQKALAQGELAYKASTALLQMSSTMLSWAVGGREALAAAAGLFSKDAQETWAQSTNRILRDATEGADMNAKLFPSLLKELNNKVPKSEEIAKAYNYFKKFGMYALDKFDDLSTQHTHYTAVLKGRNLGMTEEQAIKYGDYMSDRLQASMSNVDKAPYARTTIGRALFQFQSFTTNLAATLMNDLPNMAYHEGAEKAVSALIRTAAMASIYNEGMRDLGIPAPFSMQTFMPFMGTYRFGVPGVFGAVKGFYDAAQKGSVTGAAMQRLGRLGLDAAIPGYGQMANIMSGYTAMQKGKVPAGHEGRAMIFGGYSQKNIEKEQQQETIPGAIRKKLFAQ